MENLQDLEKQELEIRNKIFTFQEKREKELIVEYKKEFIGKYFKYRNSCGSDHHHPKWWLYCRIDDIAYVNFHNNEEPVFKTTEIQNDKRNRIEIVIRESQYIREDHIPISEKEFLTAVNSIMAKASNMLSGRQPKSEDA